MATADGVEAPVEVAGLGRAEQVFDFTTGKLAGMVVFAIVGCVIGMVLCLALACPMLACGIKPFGKNAPPPAVCFTVAGVLATLGLAFAYGAYYYAFESRERAASYHLFRDLLVVVQRETQPRQIAWERIGPEKAPASFNPRHVFPVDGESDVAFDCNCVGHGDLARAITSRSTRARWTRLLTPA